jgi:hypothetical protein
MSIKRKREIMSKMFSIVLSAFACSAFAGSVGQSGTDFVVTAASGESYTNSTDFSGSSKVSKVGEGEAVLNAHVHPVEATLPSNQES